MSISRLDSIRYQMSHDCHPKAENCWCNGSGWIISDWDSCHKCRYHYKGQPSPEADKYECDIWMDNDNGNGQFIVIPYEEYADDMCQEVFPRVSEEDLIEERWIHRLDLIKRGQKFADDDDLPF